VAAESSGNLGNPQRYGVDQAGQFR